MLNYLRVVMTRLRIALLLFPIVITISAPSAFSASNEVQSAWIKAWQAGNPVWRGIHLGLHNDEQVGKLIVQLPKLAALGANVLVVEVNYSFEYQSHPEIRPSQFVTKARVREFVKSARSHGINVIPQIN